MIDFQLEQVPSMKELAAKFAAEHPLGTMMPKRAAHALFSKMLAPPATIARWLSRFRPDYLKRRTLAIAVVSSIPDGLEAQDGGQWIGALSGMLPDVTELTLSLVRPSELRGSEAGPGFDRFQMDFAPVKTVHSSLSGYLERFPEGQPDVLVLHDIDILFSSAKEWVEPLAKRIEGGLAVAALAAGPDEFELLTGLLSIVGFSGSRDPDNNPFALNSAGGLGPWGSHLWEVTAQGRSAGYWPSDTLMEEAGSLHFFLSAYIGRNGSYPPLSRFGLTVSGKHSPAADGSPLIVLPEELYLDLVKEQFYRQEDGQLIPALELDRFAKNSAVVVAYEGRATRFSQILWAVRVFLESAQEMSSGSDNPGNVEEDDEDDQDERAGGLVCPGCGQIHGAREREEAVVSLLSRALDGETPRVKLKAALRLALAAVDEGGMEESSEEDDSTSLENAHPVAIYEELLRRDSLRGAFGLWQEDQVLDEVSTDEEGWPLLLLLMDDGLFDVAAQMLMEAEADVRTATEDGFTAYHVIGNCDGDEIGELRAMDFNETLQMYNLSPDDRDEDGDRPLDIAAMSDNWDAFEFLLDAGANVKLPDFNIEALLDSMRGYGFESLADRVEKLAGHKKPAAKRAPRKKKEN